MNVVQLGCPNDLTGPAAGEWTSVDVSQVMGPPPKRTTVEWEPDRTRLRASGYACVDVVRDDMSAIVTAPHRLPDDEMVHPLMAFVGASVARWTGRFAFHGAAVVLSGRAWILLAEPEGGKSTLASVLNARGHAVMADDMTVTDGTTVYAGPRTCDLREGAAAWLGRGTAHSFRDGRERWRDVLAPAPCVAPLGGFISLTWGERPRHDSVGLGQKPSMLMRHEALGQGPTSPAGLLDLLGYPLVKITRPHSWDGVEATLRLLESVAQS